MKSLQERNLIVPVSGDFGGPKAIRAIGAYVREAGRHRQRVLRLERRAVLFQDGKQTAFYDNVATLPMTDKSVFIRPYSMRARAGNPLAQSRHVLAAAKAGRVGGNNDALACARWTRAAKKFSHVGSVGRVETFSWVLLKIQNYTAYTSYM